MEPELTPQNVAADAAQTTPALPSPAKTYVRYLLGFGVTAAVALAPFLGVLKIPLFTPMLSLVPLDLQGTVIPISAAASGLLTLYVQWAGQTNVNAKQLKRLFQLSTAMAVVSLLLLFIVHLYAVRRVPYLAGEEFASFTVGFSERISTCPCSVELTDEECVQALPMKVELIGRCWRSSSIRTGQLLFFLSYNLFIGAFGIAVAAVFLRDLMLKAKVVRAQPLK